MKSQKKLNIILTSILSLGFILLGIFVFSSSYLRTFEALTDLYEGFKVYFCVLFGIEIDSLPSLTTYSEVIKWDIFLPEDFVTFKTNFFRFCELFVSKDNFLAWLSTTGKTATNISKIIVIILPCILVFAVAMKNIYKRPNTNHNKDTLPLKIYKKITARTVLPIKNFIQQYVLFIKEHSWIWISWLVLWAFNLNLVSILLAFFGFYFYFAVSFDIKRGQKRHRRNQPEERFV